ncbi:MAG: hypothetical protein ACYDCK_01320 [Thermoplasmatota archaeon]
MTSRIAPVLALFAAALAGCAGSPSLFGASLEVDIVNQGSASYDAVLFDVHEISTGRQIWNESFPLAAGQSVVRTASDVDAGQHDFVKVLVSGHGGVTFTVTFDACKRPTESIPLDGPPGFVIGPVAERCP